MSSRFRSTLPTSSIFSTTLDMIWSTLLNFFLYIDLGESVVDTKLFRDFCLSFQFTFSHRNLQFSSAFSFEFNFKFLHCLLYFHRYCSRFDSIHSICSCRLIYELEKHVILMFNCPLFRFNSRCFFHVAILIFCCYDLILMHIVFTIAVPIPIPTPITIIH